MQVRCDEGLANHIGPEPCAGNREVAGEAPVGGHIGQPLSRESLLVPGADALLKAEGSRSVRVTASTQTTWRGRRPWHPRQRSVQSAARRYLFRELDKC